MRRHGYRLVIRRSHGSFTQTHLLLDSSHGSFPVNHLNSSHSKTSKQSKQVSFQAYNRMLQECYLPNESTLLSLLSSFSRSTDMVYGKFLHSLAMEGDLNSHVILGNAIISMYVKCSVLVKAQEVFDEIHVRDVVSWSTLITAYAQLADVTVVIDLFNKMLVSGVKPDSITFSALLKTCSHLGLLEEAQMCYEIMYTCYDIVPTLEHQTCMVDLFGRAGHFEKAVKVMKTMLNCGSLPMWLSLLGACKKWSNLQFGKEAFRNALQLDAIDSAAYVCMYNMYSHIDVLEDV